MRWILVIGSIFGFLSVALGAFGAHALRTRLEPRMLEVFETAVRYQMFHALALVAVGLAAATGKTKELYLMGPAVCWVLGVLVFGGSLYALVLTGIKVFGAITPIGGVLYLAGWTWLTVVAVRAAISS
ncbi:MAG TPA: DUF423 domain-containing protein [Oligoflexia bacterium]|nr:DUF423 domain-containing protein [Oligoflexia bacterium]